MNTKVCSGCFLADWRIFRKSKILKISHNQPNFKFHYIRLQFLNKNSMFCFDLCQVNFRTTIPSCIFRISHFLKKTAKNSQNSLLYSLSVLTFTFIGLQMSSFIKMSHNLFTFVSERCLIAFS